MAAPAAVLSILVEATTGKAATQLRSMQSQLEATGSHVTTLEKGSGKLNKSLSGLSRPAESSAKSFRGLATAVLAAGGAFAAYEAAKDAVKDTIELGLATQRLSAITGLDTKTASTWIEVMKVRGVQARAVSMMFITLSRNVRNAEDGSKTAKKAFEELGIPLRDLKDLGTEGTLLKVADAMKGMSDPTRRAALAQQLFGRGAQALVPVLAEGKKGVDDLLASAQRYGAFLPNNVKTLRGAVEAQHAMNLAMDGLRITFATKVMPILLPITQAFLNFVVQMREGKGAGGEFANAVSGAFAVVKNAVLTVINTFGGLKNTLIVLGAAFAALKIVSLFQAVVSAVNPATLVILAFAAAAYLVVKNWSTVGPFVKRTWDGIRAAVQPTVSWLVNAWHNIVSVAQAVFPTVRNIVVSVFNTIKTVVGVTIAAVKVLWAFFGPLVKAQIAVAEFAIMSVLIPAFNAIKGPVADVAKWVKGAFETVRDIIKTVVNFVLGLFSSLLDAFAAVTNALSKIPVIGAAFKGLADHAHDASNKINDLRDQLNGLPAKKNTTVGVDVNFTSNLAGAIQSIGQSIGGALGASGAPAHGGHFAVGGMVNRPGYFAGEEAPRHPEVILATNPAYRQRNLGLWQKAGSMLGVPGFATGGLSNAAGMVGNIDPWTGKHADSWVGGKAKSWVQGIANKLSAASAAGGGGGTLPPGASQAQVASAMMAAAQHILGRPYIWGGGHGAWESPGYDCSGAVSYILHAAGLLSSPLTTDGFANWGAPGGGKFITIGDSTRRGHMMMSFFGHFLESGGGGPFGGGGPHWDPSWDGPFEISRHPPGFAQGGVYGDFGEMPPQALLAANPGLAKSKKFVQYMQKYRGVQGFAQGGIPYEGKLQKRFAGTTAYLKKMWNLAAPSYHRAGAAMPKITYTQGKDGLFVGVDVSPGKGPGHRELFIPDWIVTGKGSGGKGLNKHDAMMLELMLHEWTHEFQRNDVINKVKTPKTGGAFGPVSAAEGGAQAMALQMAPSVLGALGFKHPAMDWDSYRPDRLWVQKHLGADWVANKQFGFRRGGIFGRVPGFATGGLFGANTAKAGGNVWRVRASQEAASSGAGWTELSPNGNAAARLGIAKSFSNNPAHYPDFASLGKMFPRGTMATLRSDQTGRSATAPLTDVGDGSSFAPAVGITPALAGRLGGFPSTVLISLASNIRPFPGMGTLVSGSGSNVRVTTSGGASGSSSPTPHFPTGAVIAPASRITQGFNLPWYQKFKRVGDLMKWSKTWQAKLLGMPAPPTLAGLDPNTAAGAAMVAGRIGANKTAIDRLGGQADTLTSFYGWDSLQLLDANGNRDEKHIAQAVGEIDRVLKLREQIFNRWQMIVALTQRLVAANRLIVGRLQRGLRSISVRGLKGAQLTAANERIKNTRDQIHTYQGNAAAALSDLASSSDSRDRAWLDLDTLRKTRATMTGTPAQPVSTSDTGAGGGGAADTSASLQEQLRLSTQLLTEANQRTAVSQAQFSVLGDWPNKFVGAFASGGTTPASGWALLGEQGPELAKLPMGSRILNADQTSSAMGSAPVSVSLHFAPGTEWLKDFVDVRVGKGIRDTTRGGRAPLPGRGGGR